VTERVPYKWVVAAVFVFGMFMDIMDTTIVNVALPTLQREFGTTAAETEWIVLGYLLSMAVFIPASGWIGDRFGTKKTFLFALAMFTFGSALCGQAQNLGELVAFRVLQGVGGGMLVPVGTAMLFRAFPPHERAKASTVLLVPAVIAPATGPVVGGWLVTNADWRWIFYVNVPVGIAGFLVGLVFLREHTEGSAGPFDLPGFVLSAGSLALSLFALSHGPENGWLSPDVVVTGVLGVGMFFALLLVETRVRDPMLALRLYRERMFRNANIVLTLTYGSFAGVLFLLPLFLQGLRGLTAFESGLTTFPQAIGIILSTQVVGRLYSRVGPRRLIFFGMLGMTVVTSTFVFVGLETNLWWVRTIMFVRGIFMAFSFVPLQAATYSNITPADTGRASAIFSTQRQVAAAVGVATLATVWISRTNALADGATGAAAIDARLDGFHAAFAVATVLVFLAALSALLIRDEDAEASMRAPSREVAIDAA
jgi:EmrB/QacA subfamily drug resistance transporter